MAYETGYFETNIAAAVGNDPELMRELRNAFLKSALGQCDLMRRSRCDANWQMSAMRLRGIAASFGIMSLMDLADEALDGAPGDPVVLRRIDRALEAIQQSAASEII